MVQKKRSSDKHRGLSGEPKQSKLLTTGFGLDCLYYSAISMITSDRGSA